jgi:hypothetical protein
MINDLCSAAQHALTYEIKKLPGVSELNIQIWSDFDPIDGDVAKLNIGLLLHGKPKVIRMQRNLSRNVEQAKETFKDAFEDVKRQLSPAPKRPQSSKYRHIQPIGLGPIRAAVKIKKRIPVDITSACD